MVLCGLLCIQVRLHHCVRVRAFLWVIPAQPPCCWDLGAWSCSSLASAGLPGSATPVLKPPLILASDGANCQGAARAGCSARDGALGAESRDRAGRGSGCAREGSALQCPSKVSRAGPEAVIRFRQCPAITRQVRSDEARLRSGWEGGLWVGVLARITRAHGQAETAQKAAVSMRSRIASFYPPESNVLGWPGTLTKLQSSKTRGFCPEFGSK